MSKIIRRKVYLTFPAKQTTESIICDMYDKYHVRFNIRTASVNEQVGVMAMELEGTDEKVIEAISYFRTRGLTVEPIELNIMKE